jgi:hypothetical protein
MQQYSHYLLALTLLFFLSCGNEATDLTATALDGSKVVEQYQANNPGATQSEARRGQVTLAQTRSGMLVASLRSPDGTRRSYFVEGLSGCTDCSADMAQAQVIYLPENLIVQDEATGKTYHFFLTERSLQDTELASATFDVAVRGDGIGFYPDRAFDRAAIEAADTGFDLLR